MGQTAKYALPYPDQDEPDDVPTDLAELAAAVEAGLDGVLSSAAPPLVVALPANPADGQEVSYVIPSLSPAIAVPGLWHLKYHAGSDPFPWEFLGGSDLFDEYPEAFEACGWGFGTFGPLASGRPYVVVPLAGQYLVRAIAHVVVPAGSTAALLSLSPPMGITTTGEGRGFVQKNALGGATADFIAGEKVQTLPLGTALPFIARMTFPGYQAGAPNGIQYGEKRLYATPIRVG